MLPSILLTSHSQLVVGCFFGAICAAVWGERLGRRRTIFLGCIVMTAGAVLQSASYGRAQLIAGRIVSGLGLGVVNSTVPVLQAEFSPKASRGICKSEFVARALNHQFRSQESQSCAPSCRPSI
jgi:MFS family permease